jgi:8-oxo-dGTP diphosphatase
VAEPRIRVSAILRWRGRVLLIRHEKGGEEVWLLPGGGVQVGESLTQALQRELVEEVGLFAEGDELPVEGPVALVDSIAPRRGLVPDKHVVHIIFAGVLPESSLEAVSSSDSAVRGHRLFELDELEGVVLHPPIKRFLRRWRPGDPTVYLGSLWAP